MIQNHRKVPSVGDCEKLRRSILIVSVAAVSLGYVAWDVVAASPACAPPSHSGISQVWVAGGAFTMGSSDYYPEESVIEGVRVNGFWIDAHELTNQQFARFVDDTGYITVAERSLDPIDYLGVPTQFLKSGSAVFVAPRSIGDKASHNQWWRFVHDANWRAPLGAGSNINELEDHPVVHVAYEDAVAYAEWAKRSLPTEADWEFAARGGLDKKRYEWGDEMRPDGIWRANTWQGSFPTQNSAGDGYALTAPVGSFPPNGYGLFDMTGNVWEWVSDWYYPRYLNTTRTKAPTCNRQRLPTAAPVRVIKGGSYLCAENFCMRYRPAARQPQEATLSTSHIGFRTVARCNQ